MGGEQGMTPTGRGLPRSFAVLGSPVAHSLSPVMHRAAHAALGVADARYEAIDVPAGTLAEALARGAGRRLAGASVTMPLKREAFDLAVEHDAISAELGIANTLLRRPDGTWRAENHDVHGIARSLRDHGAERIGTAAVIGSGATALSAVTALSGLGAREIALTARSPEKLAPLVAAARAAGADARVVPWERALEVLAADVVVSALALPGARRIAESMAAAPSDAPRPRLLLDVLYDPWPAPVAAAAALRGTEVASGLEMLAHQAARQVESMLGVPVAPVAAMLRAAEEALAARAGSAPHVTGPERG